MSCKGCSSRRKGPSAPPEFVGDDAVVEHAEEEGARALGATHAVVPAPPHHLAIKLSYLRAPRSLPLPNSGMRWLFYAMELRKSYVSGTQAHE